MNQHYLLQQALPRIHAAESLQHHLQCAGLNVGCMIEVGEDGVCVLLLVAAPHQLALNVIEHAGLDARPISQSQSELLDVRSYETDVFGQAVTLVVQAPTAALQPAPQSRFAAWLRDYRTWLDDYRQMACRAPLKFVQTSGDTNFLNPGAADRRYWPADQQPPEGVQTHAID
jgi:hypothetical protein